MEIKNKKVIVTGADGFIGSHLVEKLIDEGCDVTAFVFYNSFNSLGWIDTFSEEMKNKIKVISGDIRDLNGVRDAFKNQEIVFHLAALVSIPYSYQSVDSFFDTNIKGTINVLHACRDLNIQKVLITSSSEVYGTATYVPITELHPKQAQSPYSASKIGADSISEAFYKSFDLPITIVRPFNTYGPRQSARAVIPNIIIQLLSGSKELKLGNLLPTRDLLFVKDTINGFVEIAKSDSLIGHEVNIASQSEISIEKIANELIRQINPSAKIISDFQRIRPENSEVFRLFGSNEKIISMTNWKPTYSFEKGMMETINWFSVEENRKQYKPNIYNF